MKPPLLQQKLIATATGISGASLISSLQSSAAIVASTGIPTPTNPSASWDVDGDGTLDFSLNMAVISNVTYQDFDDLNGGRLIVPTPVTSGGIAHLASGLPIAATLPAAYKFHNNGQASNTIWAAGNIAPYPTAAGWRINTPGFFGFKFTNASGIHYGWGEMTIGSSGYTISQAHYETTAGASITVGATVPEPSSLVLLALGTVGLTTIRRRRTV